ncbi:glycoside hydrolase family 5 protein [Shinella sp.]|uniref:glycoside hydrolase family 5 protein n=1 Tax=Shinella sp. TaxID=1870904 RepID=UPI003F6E4F89
MTSPALSRRRVLSLAGISVLATSLPPSFSAAKEHSVPSRGVNLPGWFDREDGLAPAQAVLEKLRRCGFETIRLPIDGDVAVSGTMARRRIAQGIATLLAAGFAVLADLHPSTGLHAALRTDPAAGGTRVAEAWVALRSVIADLPADRVYPELLNEPPMTPAAWLSLRDRLAGIVRAACPHHTIIWGPAPDQGIWQLDGTPPLSDDRQIVAVHFYAPMAFTHQCQSWGASPLARIRGLPFPATRDTPVVAERIAALRAAGDEEAALLVEEQLTTDWTEAAIGAQFEKAARWSAASRCPVMLNEFGVLDFCVDGASRTAWVRAVRRAAEARGIGWAYWELDQGFGFIESRTSTEGFDSAMLDALFGTGG